MWASSISKTTRSLCWLARSWMCWLYSGEQRGKGGPRLQPHADGELPVKVATVDRRIMNIVNAVTALGEVFFQSAQQTGLARTGIAGHDGGGAAFQRGFQTLSRRLQGFRIEHLRGGNVFAEGRPCQAVGR